MKRRETTSSRWATPCGSSLPFCLFVALLTALTRRQGLPLPDPYLKLHDARFLRPLTPIPFPTPPAFVKFHPRLSGNVVVASADGRVQILDLKDVGKSSVFQVAVRFSSPSPLSAFLISLFPQVESPSMLTSMAISPTGEGLAFGDADGFVHLWSARPEEGEAQFCRFEGEVELPDTAEPIERINWRDDTCVSDFLTSLLHETDPISLAVPSTPSACPTTPNPSSPSSPQA